MWVTPKLEQKRLLDRIAGQHHGAIVEVDEAMIEVGPEGGGIEFIEGRP